MDYKPLSSRDEIRDALEAFRERMYEDGISFKKQLGWQGGGAGAVDVYWNPETKVWAYFDPEFEETRYWCAFGVSDAIEDENINIVCEINFPLEGTTRCIAGAFFTDGDYIYVGHSGKVGGGMKGVGKCAFRKYCEDVDIVLLDYPGNKKVDLIRIGSLADPDLPLHIADFVKKVAGFKEFVRQTAGERTKSGKSMGAHLTGNGDGPADDLVDSNKKTARNWAQSYKTRGKPLTKKGSFRVCSG